jgi:pimeloyl-ACP methyl ester carboxylesterase
VTGVADRPTARLAAFTIAGTLVGALVLLSSPVSNAQPGELACDQEPGSRFFWLERAFCDLPPNGPERALGVVIWNHGISGSTQSWKAPAPPALRLLQTRDWDVIMLKRHHLAETMPGSTLFRTVQRTLEEAAASRKLGYRRVALAGQSFGGYASLEAVDTSPDLDAVVAFAPGVRASGATGALDPSITDRILRRAKVGRVAVVFPKNDELFGYLTRGESARAILARRSLPYLLLDETSGLSGHGGGVSGRFALRYGLCLADFLAADSLPPGRFTCPPVADEWLVVRELLLPPAAERPSFVREAAAFPAPVGALLGPRWALLADTVVLVAIVDGGSGRLRLMYRSSSGFGSGVFEAAANDGVIQAVLSNRSTVTLKPEGDGTITWTAADGSRSLKAQLALGRDDP